MRSMGFETGNILEPSMGVGNFFGMLPEKMQNSRLYGVELDPDVYKRQLLMSRCRQRQVR